MRHDQDGPAARPGQSRSAACLAETRTASSPADKIGCPVVREMYAGMNSVLVMVKPDSVTRSTPVSLDPASLYHHRKFDSPYETNVLPSHPSPTSTCAWVPM